MNSKRISFLLAFFLSSALAFADVRLPAVLSDHMVLRQNSTVTLWGWCDPGEKISVRATWDTARYTATGTAYAQWRLQLKTPAAGGPYHIAIEGNNKIGIDDVLIGEVWLCSGQSNMQMSMDWGLPYAAEAAAATNSQIRFFHIPRTSASYPQDDVKAHWVVCNPEDMKRFSAVGYFFGRRLQETLQLPVGLIDASWSGTPAEPWTPAEAVTQDTALAAAAALLKPSEWWPEKPGAAFNAMLHPLHNFPIAGTIWYQGESNVGTSATYRQLLTTMIGAWRRSWQEDLPFYYVQIAPFAGYGDNSSSAFLREQQTQALTFPNTGMVLTSDLVDSINDIHPKRKKEVGERLANLALAKTYGKTGFVFEGPFYQSMKIEKNRVRIHFSGAGKGLVSKGGAPNEFYIAGADQHFVPAMARIEGHDVVVWSKQVTQPVAVRFGFRNAAQPNLFGAEGLPVNLFRTDNWPVDVTTK